MRDGVILINDSLTHTLGFRQTYFDLSEWTTLIVYKCLLKLIHSFIHSLVLIQPPTSPQSSSPIWSEWSDQMGERVSHRNLERNVSSNPSGPPWFFSRIVCEACLTHIRRITVKKPWNHKIKDCLCWTLLRSIKKNRKENILASLYSILLVVNNNSTTTNKGQIIFLFWNRHSYISFLFSSRFFE